MQELKMGIFGYGRMGHQRHQSAKNTGLAKVTKIFDPEGEIPSELMVSRESEILGDPEIQAVFVCTVNSENERLSIAALESGKHVFCEKPPALSADGVRRVQAVMHKTGKVVMYGFNHRHHGAARKMKEVLDSSHFGKILWMRGRYGKSVSEDYFSSWRANKEIAGGGILIDQGIHMLDLMNYLSEGFDEYQAMASNLYWDTPGMEDNVFLNMKNNESGLVASMHSTMVQWRHLFSLEVFLEKGNMALNGLKTSTDSYGAERLVINKNIGGVPIAKWELEEELEWPVDDSWNEEMKLFHSWVTSGVRPEGVGSTEDAERVMEIVDFVYSQDLHRSNYLNLRPKLYKGGQVV